MEGRLLLEGWWQRDYYWRSRPPASLWLANRWPLCQTWNTGQHYLHIKSLSEQESLSLQSPVSLILKGQWVNFVCKVSDVQKKTQCFPQIIIERNSPRGHCGSVVCIVTIPPVMLDITGRYRLVCFGFLWRQYTASRYLGVFFSMLYCEKVVSK